MAKKRQSRKAPTKKAASLPSAAEEQVPSAGSEEQDERGGRLIILLRHGIAEPKVGSKPDEDRSLTKEGHARMKQISRGLAEIFPRAEAIYSSPLLRCVQTALWVSKGYRGELRPQTTDVLLPGASADSLRKFIDSAEERRLILVGHEPNLSDGFQKLLKLGGSSGSLELKKGGCYGVRIADDGSARLEWVLTPRVLRRLAE
jgi:phosphohistidine phosphatase